MWRIAAIPEQHMGAYDYARYRIEHNLATKALTFAFYVDNILHNDFIHKIEVEDDNNIVIDFTRTIPAPAYQDGRTRLVITGQEYPLTATWVRSLNPENNGGDPDSSTVSEHGVGGEGGGTDSSDNTEKPIDTSTNNGETPVEQGTGGNDSSTVGSDTSTGEEGGDEEGGKGE